jgi:protection-of-telomeres protein 1
VVDFFPPEMEDFTQCLDDPNYNDVSSSLGNSTMSMDDSSLFLSRWEWSFYILVEDARPLPGQPPVQMPLLIQGQDAEFLLNLQATE